MFGKLGGRGFMRTGHFLVPGLSAGTVTFGNSFFKIIFSKQFMSFSLCLLCKEILRRQWSSISSECVSIL